jgi:hypothetical protein
MVGGGTNEGWRICDVIIEAELAIEKESNASISCSSTSLL